MRAAVSARRQPLRGTRAAAAEREEAALDELIAERAAVTRPNTIAVLSPKGGVGKTTCTFLLGNLLASKANLRCVAVDANPDFGTLGSLAPESARVEGTLADVFAQMDDIYTAAELKPLVAVLSTGLHLIAAPPHAEVMAAITPELYRLLTDFLGRFYDVILLDLGTGISGPVAQCALEEADQKMVVSTPDFVTASTVLGALHYMRGEGLTIVLNQAPRLPDDAGRQEIEHELRGQEIEEHVIVPYDDRLRVMIDTATYDLAGLERETRIAIGQLALSAARWLV